jgi:hypothetical protein
MPESGTKKPMQIQYNKFIIEKKNWPLNLANFVRYEAKKTHLYSQNLQRTTERKKSQLFTCTKFIGIR